MKSSELVRSALLAASLTVTSNSAHALVIGHYDSSREGWGMSTGYISGAAQWLIEQGHTLVSTSYANSSFLSTVDAFYTGLINSVSTEEISSFENFVDSDGGFLFIQQDHSLGAWHGAANQILANWGIGNYAGYFGNDSGHSTVGNSSWVTYPNLVTGFSGAAHTSIDRIPVGFETIAVDDLGRAIMGAFDAGAGRSSDVFVATDIDFWSDMFGWNDIRNRQLWENIWTTASVQIDPPPREVSEPETLALFGIGLSLLGWIRRSAAKNR